MATDRSSTIAEELDETEHASTSTEIPTGSGSVGEVGGRGAEQHPLADAGQEITQDAGTLAQRATDLGLQQADRGREQAAQGLEQLSDSIRRVSQEMETEQPAIANVAGTAAEQAERIAEYLRTTDVREMIGTVEDVARRQPLLFVGGAFLLGVAASRFIKAAGGSGASGAYGTSGGSMQSPTGQLGVQGRYGYDAYAATGPGGSRTTLEADGRTGEGI